MKLIYLLISISILSSCSHNKFEGEWIIPDNVKLSFNNNKYTWTNIKHNIIFYGNYQVSEENDSLILNTQHGIPLYSRYKFVDNTLILWNIKADSGETKGHIDEIYCFTKSQDHILAGNSNLKKDIITIPLGFIGNVFINYNQKEVGNKEFNYHQDHLIQVNENGLAKTEFEESVLLHALSLYEFRSPEKEYSFFIDDMIKDNELNNLSNDSVYVCVYGFNQTGRKNINTIFGEALSGNVLMLRVDTLKNIIKTMDNY